MEDLNFETLKEWYYAISYATQQQGDYRDCTITIMVGHEFVPRTYS